MVLQVVGANQYRANQIQAHLIMHDIHGAAPHAVTGLTRVVCVGQVTQGGDGDHKSSDLVYYVLGGHVLLVRFMHARQGGQRTAKNKGNVSNSTTQKVVGCINAIYLPAEQVIVVVVFGNG